MPPAELVFNGVDAESGGYLRPPLSLGQIAERLAPRQRRRRTRTRWMLPGVDPDDLAQTGWGVIFGPDSGQAVREALAPLLAHRRAASSRRDASLYRELCFLPGDSYDDFRRRYGLGPGPADPARMPYYLLIVGSPEAVPFDVQYQLDVQYAVGRIWFDTLEEHASYARNVVAAETGRAVLPRRMALFAPVHAADPLTRLSAEQLVAPLADTLAAVCPGWDVRTRIAEEATKEELGLLLGGAQTPALLLTASHGIGLAAGSRRQPEVQGALVCQSWQGPEARKISGDDYFAASDVGQQARLRGLVCFCFACYSAGTPRWDSFAHLDTGEAREVAPRPFLARLPQRLLGHDHGALAIVGHIDQAWPCSFLWEDTGAQLQVFQSALQSLAMGRRIGAAMEAFGQRYAEIAAELSSRLEPVLGAGRAGGLDTFKLWLAHNDARSYVVLGDPAVRLPVEELPPPRLRSSTSRSSAPR